MSIKAFSISKNKTVVKYLSASFLALPVSLVTGFMTFRNIEPYFMGIWATLTVFETYATFLRLGVINGMNRELPFALGAGEEEKAHKYVATTLAYTLINMVLLMVLVPAATGKLLLDPNYFLAVVVFIAKICLSFYTTYLTGTFRSDDHFNKLSNIQFITQLSALVFCPLVLMGFKGFLAYQVLYVLTNAILLHLHRPFRIKPKLHKPELKQLIGIGFPIFLSSFCMGAIDTLPRLYIVKFGNESLLGLYGPVLMLLNTMAILPNSLSSYMYPKFSFRMGSDNNATAVWKQMLKIYAVCFAFLVGAVVIVYFVIDYVILLFPKYAGSLPYLKLALLVCPFIFYKLGNLLSVVLKDRRSMLNFVIVYGVIQLASLWVCSSIFEDVLKASIVSQVATAFLVFIAGLGLNYASLRKTSVG